MMRLSLPRLTMDYLFALVLIGALSIASHLSFDHALTDCRRAGAMVEASARQRMLSQRIGWMATLYQNGDTSARRELVAATDAFESANARFTSQLATATPAATADHQLAQLYFDGPNSLNNLALGLVAAARVVAGHAPNDRATVTALAKIRDIAGDPLLSTQTRALAIRQQADLEAFHRVQTLPWTMLAIVLLTLVMEALFIFRPMINRMLAFTQDMARLAETDPLTALANRRSFLMRAALEVDRARRTDQPLSVLLIDADLFKRINDTHGHDMGDRVLIHIARSLADTVRPEDFVARMGGEEFAVLLPGSPVGAAAQVAEKLREAIAQLNLSCGAARVAMTVSIGVAPVPPGPTAIERALRDADAALYQAKRNGRNQVCAAQKSARASSDHKGLPVG